MAARLKAETSETAQKSFDLDQGDEWILGRDAASCQIVVMDPACPLRCALLKKRATGYSLQSLTPNSVHINDAIFEGERLLAPLDRIRVGHTTFCFSMDEQSTPTTALTLESSGQSFDFEDAFKGTASKDPTGKRWLLKILAGPNSGAQMNLEEGTTYTIGSDSSACDIVLTDLSVSKQHLKISLGEEGNLSLEDLKSRNGVLVNGEKISSLSAQTASALVTLGSTTLMLVDRKAQRKALISPPIPIKESLVAQNAPSQASKSDASDESKATDKASLATLQVQKTAFKLAGRWSRMLVVSACALLTSGIIGFAALSRVKPLLHQSPGWERQALSDLLESYPFTFNFDPQEGKVVLQGHVSTSATRQEVIAKIRSLAFVDSIDSGDLVIDDSLCREFNQILKKDWPDITLTSSLPGKFTLEGEFQKQEQMDKLKSYLALNFPYPDSVQSDVLVIDTLTEQINLKLQQIAPGELICQFQDRNLVIAGSLPANQETVLENYIAELQKIPGIGQVRNATISRSLGEDDASAIDITSRYNVTGSTSRSSVNVAVVVNGRILQRGDLLDQMTITSIRSDSIILLRNGIRYRIRYSNL